MENFKFKNPELVLLSAFRYALGRRTYIVSVIVTEFIANWNNFTESTQLQIQEEIINYKKEHSDLGMSCDEAEWNKILELNHKI